MSLVALCDVATNLENSPVCHHVALNCIDELQNSQK